MRVALVGPVYPFRGGIAHYTTRLGRALAELGHETLVVSYRRQYPRWLYPGASDRDPSAAADDWRVEAEYVLDTLWPPTWGTAARRVADFGADLAVLQWWTSFMGPLTWALARGLRLAGVRVGFVIHNVLPHEPRVGDRWLARAALGLGQAYLVQTEGERARLEALLPGVGAVVAGHPVHMGFGVQGLTRATARAALGLPAEGGVILFFGIVRPYKGLRVLLRAVAALRAEGRPAHLVVAGEFWEDRRGYEAEIAALGLEGWVRLTGQYIPNEAVADYFAAADVFAAPYVGGTQSAAVKVARGFGVPIVTTRAEDVAGMVLGPLGAQVVGAGDVAALASALGAALAARDSRPEAPAHATPPDAVAGWGALAEAVVSLARPAA